MNGNLDARPREPMTRWNKRSDIQLTLNLFSRGVRYNPNVTTDDLTFVFFTDGSRKYKCGRIGTITNGITINEDGSVTCYLDRPFFNPGRLHVEVFVSSPNGNFNDASFDVCRPSCLPILIVDGPSDDVDPNVSVALSLPYIEVTIWDALVGHGYLGTSDEFWRKFVGLMAGNSISADGAIRVVLASMGEEYDGEGFTHELAPGECIYDGTRYQIAYMDNNGVVTYYTPSADLIYCNAVTNILYRWNGSGWTQIGGSGGSIGQNAYISSAAVVGNMLVISTTANQDEAATVIVSGNTLIINNRITT
jgi:hypothetical protein